MAQAVLQRDVLTHERSITSSRLCDSLAATRLATDAG